MLGFPQTLWNEIPGLFQDIFKDDFWLSTLTVCEHSTHTTTTTKIDQTLKSYRGTPLAEPERQNRGGQILAEIFQRPFLGVLEKMSAFSPQIFHLSPKISDDLLFLVINLF